MSSDPAFLCSADEDCTVVRPCECDECNGGFAVAAHVDEADRVRFLTGGCCEKRGGCTLLACLDEPVPTCVEGACVFGDGRPVVR